MFCLKEEEEGGEGEDAGEGSGGGEGGECMPANMYFMELMDCNRFFPFFYFKFLNFFFSPFFISLKFSNFRTTKLFFRLFGTNVLFCKFV